MGSSRRMVHSSNQFSADSMGFSDGRFKFAKNSYACTALILLLFRFQYIGGLMVFSNDDFSARVSVIHYMLTSAFIMLPLLYMYLFVGHYSKLGCLVIGRIVPVTHGVGYTMTVITVVEAIYDMAVACDALIYLKESFSTSLSFMQCQKSWGDDCIGQKEMDRCLASFTSDEPTTTKACNFTSFNQLSAYKYRVYELRELKPKENDKNSAKIEHFWKKIEGQRVIYLVLCTILVLLVTDLDVSANNKTTNIIFSLFFAMILILCGITITQLKNTEGVFDIFDVETVSTTIFSFDVWYESLLYFIKVMNLVNVCTVLIGSYMPSYSMTDLQAFISWIGLMSLYFLGEMMTSLMRSALASRLGTEPRNVFVGGIDAVLVLYPQFLGSLNFCPQAAAGIFFFLLLSSSLYRVKLLLSAVYHTIADGKPVIRMYRFYIRIFSCFFLMLFALPICVIGVFRQFLVLLRIIEDCLCGLALIISSTGILYIYGTQTLFDDHHFTYGSQPAIFFKMTLLGAPIVLIAFGAMLFTRVSNLYSHKPLIAMSLYIVFPICISFQLGGLLYITYYYLKRQNMAHLLKCEESWGDPNPNVRKERIIYHPRKETNYFRRIDVCKHNCLRYNRITPVIINDENHMHNDGYRFLKKHEKVFADEEIGISKESLF